MKGKNMLPRGSVFFPLRVALMRIDKITLKIIKSRNCQKLNNTNMSVFKKCQMLMLHILSVIRYLGQYLP